MLLQVLGWKAAATAAQSERDVVLHHARLAAHQQQIAVAQLVTAVQATLSEVKESHLVELESLRENLKEAALDTTMQVQT